MKFRKKPVVIEAIKYTGDNAEEIFKFCDKAEFPDDELVIKTLEGTMIVSDGDWVIKGVKGEFYPCKSDIFEATYERVEE